MKSVSEYLSLVKDWEDPFPTPVLEIHQGVTVVRDDLLKVGSKSRFCDKMIGENKQVKEWVYGSSPRVGFGQVSLAWICKTYKKKCTVFIAKGNELHKNTALAKHFGAKIVEVPMGFLKVTEARAREYVAEDPNNRCLVPFGLADDTVTGSIIKVAQSLDVNPQEVWSVAGSGVLNRGLQLAWPNAKFNMVSVGHKLTTEEIGKANCIIHPLKFAQACKKSDLPPFPSVIEYDAKCWQFIPKNSGRRTVFWNVA